MPLRAIYYDTETTGTKAEKDRIVEIAAYDPERNRSFVSFVNPGIPIPVEATAIHNISDEMVATAPSFSSVAQQFMEFCEGSALLIAHNNDNFDLLFLQKEFSRHSLIMPTWKFLDTLKWARRYRPDLPRHTLQFLREVYGIKANNAHRALDDVTVLYELFSSMIGDLPLDEVYALLNAPRPLQHMPFGKYQGTPLSQVPKDYISWLASSGALDKTENSELKKSLQLLALLS